MTTLTLTADSAELKARIERFQAVHHDIVAQVRRVIVGQEQVLEQVLIGLFMGGHCLITGLPGTAKTLLVRTIAQTLGLVFRRIQFTPDLMPSDITGTDIIEEDPTTGHRRWTFVAGPIFGNVLLADEINRTPPKTQSALLEAMEEKQVTVAGERRFLARPFFVLATQNPIELEGTYPLPEAQLDRFMFNILIDYLNEDQELEVATRTTSGDLPELESVFSGQDMIDFARLTRQVPVAEPVARYAVRLTQASRPGNGVPPEFVTKWVSWGAGTRGTQSLLLGAKARALLKGRFHVSCADIRTVALSALRHRILTNFRAEADHVSAEDIIAQLLEAVPEPRSGLA